MIAEATARALFVLVSGKAARVTRAVAFPVEDQKTDGHHVGSAPPPLEGF
jgi:hypothetical protein